MTPTQAVVFDLSGEFAYFRVPSTNRMILTFPFPPRTALIGLIAGVLGMPRNSYWSSPDGIGSTDVAIEIRKPGVPMFLRVNSEQTKPSFTGIKFSNPDAMLTMVQVRNTWGFEPRGFTTLEKMQVLRGVAYRVFCRFHDGKMEHAFEQALREHEYIYPPYLGNVNFFAQLEHVGTVPLQECMDRDVSLSSVVSHDVVDPDNDAMRFGTFSTCFDMPRSCIVSTAVPDDVVTGVIGDTTLIESAVLGNYFYATNMTPLVVGLKPGSKTFRARLPDRESSIAFM